MIVFTDTNYSGSLLASKIVTKSYILYVRRVLHPPLSKIPVTRILMQGSIRDFFISNVKNIPQNKTITCVLQKTMKTKDTQLTESDMQWGKRPTECIGLGIFWCAREYIDIQFYLFTLFNVGLQNS